MSEMTDAVILWLESTFTANPYWVTAIISVVPMIEVRGAITVGINLRLNPWIAWLLSCASSLIVCPVLLLFLKPILNLLKKIKFIDSFAVGLEEIFLSKAEKIRRDSEEGLLPREITRFKRRKALGVFLFVALPLPLTGVWTGSAVAAFLDLQYRYSVPAIVLGNLTSGLIITLLNLVLGDYSSLILIVLMAFVVISLVSLCVGVIIKRKKHLKAKASEQKERERTHK
jgi:uncharacterized membrane protein